LIEGINNQYNDIEWGYGISKFWEDEIFNYNIVHIHWPNVFIWNHDKHCTNNTNDYEERILSLKSKGIKIISTCHNLKPHYSNNTIEHSLYDITYKYSDCILHLGKYSLNLFKKEYPNSEHLILLHHTYDSIYNHYPTYEESVKALNLNPNYKYILCFGAFRSNEERELIITIAKYLKNRNIAILAPSFIKIPQRRNFFYKIKPYFKYIYYKLWYPNIIISKYFINDKQLEYYYGASVISLIQRLKILNSGNISLGFLMKKIVIGPNVGNVGTWLKDTNNLTFDPNNITTLFNSIELAIKNTDKGGENYQYAKSNLSTQKISSTLYHYYKQAVLSSKNQQEKNVI